MLVYDNFSSKGSNNETTTQPKNELVGKMASQQLVHHICEIEVSPRLQLKFVYKTSEDEGEHIEKVYNYTTKCLRIGPIDPKPNSHILLPVAAANDKKSLTTTLAD